MKLKLISFFLLLTALGTRAQLTSTNLPIVMINVSGAIGTTQTQASMSIIDNVSGLNHPTDIPVFTGMIGVNVRGNTTYPKSSYSVETWSAPTVSLDTALLGMPSENDWVLLSSYEDRSLQRNMLAARLHEKMERYAPRMRYCELLINNAYMGVYTFGERIKRDSLRLDIAKLTPLDNAGINLTGGYIVKIDGNANGWDSGINPPYGTTQVIHFEYDYPSDAEITPVQQAYIKSYVDSFETALNGANFQDTLIGWRKHGAVNAFADYMIIQEVARNNEAYRKNSYLYKDKGTKLRPGPLWNFDLSFRNTADCNSSLDTGWTYHYGGVCGTSNKLAPFWWMKLSSDTSFMDELKCRYSAYRKSGQLLDTTSIFHMIDSVSALLNANGAVSRNFTQWPIWGTPIVNEPTPMASNYGEELQNLKTFIKNRLTWLDTKWLSTSTKCYPLAVQELQKEVALSFFPNPAENQVQITIQGLDNAADFNVTDVQGRIMESRKVKNGQFYLDCTRYPSGLYMIQLKSASASISKKLIRS